MDGAYMPHSPVGELVSLEKGKLTRSLFDLRGKKVVVTGGTGAIGSAVVKGLFREGASVAVIGRDQAKLDALYQSLRNSEFVYSDATQSFLPVQFNDVVSVEGLTKCRDYIFDKFGVPDSLLLMLGGNRKESTVGPSDDILNLKPEEFAKTVDFNLMQGGVNPAMVFLKRMIPERQANRINIVGIGSEAGIKPLTRVGGYGAGKAAFMNYLAWLATELPKRYPDVNIGVNTVTPGFVIGEQNRHLLTNPDGTMTDRGKQIIAHTPISRYGKSEEMVAPVLSLISDGFQFVNGENIIVDGGFSNMTI